jgi:peptidoglycan/LPS O-acetylase OafA/YrhL
LGLRADQSERLAGLDLLRGVAALGVLVLHLHWGSPSAVPLPKGYLAVDLFFVLSGFVIAYSYDHRLGSTELLKRFCIARLIRLYPLYLVATLFSAVILLTALLFGRGTDSDLTGSTLAASFATALLFLPTPSNWSVEPTSLFPLVFPAWSLFWELLVNIFYGAISTRLRRLGFVMLMAVGMAGILASMRIYGSAGGVTWDGGWVGGARALFSFFAGVALFRLRRRWRAPRVPALPLAILLLLAFVPGRFGWAYDLACIVLLFPLLVWLGADARMGPKVTKAGTLAGFLSYPVYLLQAPLIICFAVIMVRANAYLPPRWAVVAVEAAVVFGVSWLVARWIDSPVRDRLRARAQGQVAAPAAQTAP